MNGVLVDVGVDGDDNNGDGVNDGDESFLNLRGVTSPALLEL